MTWEKKRLLIWGTTYPEFSKTYFETVCTGAIDAETGKLVRIYPITLRYLEDRFKHYQWIEAEVERNSSDFRPESYRIRQDTIRILERIDTNEGWSERSRWVLRTTNVFKSLEDLRSVEEKDHTSLGLIKPVSIERVYSVKKTEEERQEWEAARASAQAQRDIFVDVEATTRDLQFVPVRYHVDFTCQSVDGPKRHKCSVLDWGTYVLHRRMIAQHGSGVGERKVIDKIKENLDLTKKDAYLFMGNSKAHCQSFSIVGFYYPPLPKQVRAQAPQTLSLPGLE
ncbi:hypothetical protein OV203_33720 [Nannocystis sp. ILAH1]|uniref:hypothetical protein n=1 Tax=Nannocystis sp. ILAH1 TaxID=2996789 RepID=UPI00226EE7EE|nr:hypothetical protein [Nannocystis sp. ILAH1]MCY0992145.1 hypothetical protein [Nannocystis sp. ILAH1]